MTINDNQVDSVKLLISIIIQEVNRGLKKGIPIDILEKEIIDEYFKSQL